MNPDHPPSNRRRQQGVVLAVSLILLAVIGIGSVAALRSGVFSNLVAHNLRSNQLAVQAAEMALRFCERQAMADPPAIPVQPLPAVNTARPVLWNDLDQWEGAATIATSIAAEILDSPKSDARYLVAPQCLVEAMELRRSRGAFDETAFLITARGFSPDYSVDADGVVNGSEVWLQSVIRFTR